MSKKKIAVHIQSEVQFFTLEPLLRKLKQMPYQLEIVTDDFGNDKSGYKEIASGTVELIKKAGFSPKAIDSFPDTIFDVYLTTYIDEKIKTKCYLKYEYGTLNIKPNLTYTPEVMGGFHGFLCQSTVTANLLQVYGKTFPVDNLRFFGKKKVAKNKEKKQVLFAPTYNDNDTEEELVEIVKNLKRAGYEVVVKGHHGTEYLTDNAGKKQVLMELADKYYGSETSLTDLILKADVCLFGNSSAIAEALYAEVPCAIISTDLDFFKLGDIHTTQFEFVRDGFIPHCEKSDDVVKIIHAALTEKYKLKQHELAKKIFPKEYQSGVEGYVKVIEYFLNDELAQDYIELHNYNIKEKELLRSRIQECEAKLNEKNAEFEDYRKRKLNRLSDKIYKIQGRIINGKS